MLADSYQIQVLLMTLSGLVNRHLAEVIGYLVEESQSHLPVIALRRAA